MVSYINDFQNIVVTDQNIPEIKAEVTLTSDNSFSDTILTITLVVLFCSGNLSLYNVKILTS